MSEETIKIAVSESYNGDDVIPNLIETARNLLDTNIDQSKDFFEKALILSRNNHYKTGHAECLLELSKIQTINGDYLTAYKYLQEASLIFDELDNDSKLYECLLKLSDISFNIGNFSQALDSSLTALQIAKKLNVPDLIANIYLKTGKIYESLGDYIKAIDNHQLALEIFTNHNNRHGIAEACFFIGNGYNQINNHDDAFIFLDKSLNIADELNDSELRAKSTGNIAVLFTRLKQTDRAKDYFYKAIDFVNITGQLSIKADLIRHLGDLFIETRQYEEAIKSLQEALEIATTLKSRTPLNLIHKSIAEAFEHTGDFQKAHYHYKQYNTLSNELNNEQVTLKSKGIQLKYDFEEANKEKMLADKAVLLKDQFIANISHEIRTPLNGVLGMADLLADTNPTPEQLEYINTIRLSANNLIYLINDILDFSKIQSGEFNLEKSEFVIRNVINEISRELKSFTDEKKINLVFKVDDQVPEILIGDAVRLKQILVNILNNAIKFTEKGSVKFEVQLTQFTDKDVKILFNITDTGIGITDEKIGTIFESFAQLSKDNSKTSGGPGLGLAIVKQLVDLQGGTISVNSKIGTGSVFKVELPFKITKPLKTSSGSSRNMNGSSTTDVSDMVILLVEDNKVNQFLAQKLLSKMGFAVVIADNGNEAIELLKKQKFNIILMDVQMPEMNGYELTEVIRTTLPDPVNSIPIIALTAYASLQEKEKALALGMSDYITKPYSPHELMTSIMKQVALQGKPTIQITTDQTSFNPETIKQTSDRLLQLFSGSVNDVLSLLHMLISQIPILLDEAETAINNKNWPVLFQTIHKLKSSVNLLKINTLVNLVSEIEELSRDEMQTSRIPEIFKNLRSSCETAVSLMKEEIIRLKKTV